MIHVVAAEFVAPERAVAVAEWLREQFTRCSEPLPNVWIVDGPLGAEQILNGLKPLCGRSDGLVIVKAGTEAVWRGLSPADALWMAGSFPGGLGGHMPGEAEGRSVR